MILKQTDDYIFIHGHAGRVLLKNNITKQHEVWVRAEPGALASIIWCFYNHSFWLTFDHVATEADISEAHEL